MDFSERLRLAGLSQSEFRRLVHRLTGVLVSSYSINRWAKGKNPPPAIASALLELISRIPPRFLEDILSQYPEIPLSPPQEDEDDD